MGRARTWLLAGALAAGCRFEPSIVSGGGGDGGGRGDPDAGLVTVAPDASLSSPDAAPAAVRFRKALTVPADRVAGPLSDFPVYVALTDQDLRDRAGATGEDIHFVDGDGPAALDHEIQAWDPSTGRLEAWVRLPALSDAADTVFYVRYGDFDDPAAPDPAGVWQNGFVAVWHLEQVPGGVRDEIIDSTGGNDATSASMNAASLVAGALGRGLSFDGGADQLTFDNPLLGASPHTISAWVQQLATDDNDALVVLGDGACWQARWLHSRFDGGDVAMGFYCDDVLTTGIDLVGSGWRLVHWTYDFPAVSRLYRDGVLAAGPFTHSGAQSTSGGVGRIGNAPGEFGQNMGLNGLVDEVRISNVARSPEWIATEHANQGAPGAFVLVGPEEPLP
jgi:hypothetical protein